MRYRNFKALLKDLLITVPELQDIEIYPGPNDPGDAGRCIVLTASGGTGLNTESLFDSREWQIKVISDQEDYESGEDLAFFIDQYLCSVTTGTYHEERVTHITRTGGAPLALLVDDAERTHFVCSYLVDVQSAPST